MPGFKSLCLATCAILCCLTNTSAAPISFHFTMKHLSYLYPEHSELWDAQMDLTLSWDAATLTPLYDGPSMITSFWATGWPLDNTVGSLAVSRVTTGNGVYPISIGLTEYDIWRVERWPDHDKIYTPDVSFNYLDYKIVIKNISAELLIQGGAWGSTAYPVAFGRSDVSSEHADVSITKPSDPNYSYPFGSYSVAGYFSAEFVPEPASISIFAFGVLGLAAARRKR